MKKWPRLSIEAQKRLGAAEGEAKRQLGDNVRPYTPGNPDWFRNRDNILEGGYRVIDFICGYAEAILDTHAAEYSPEALRSSGVLRERIVPLARKQAAQAYDSWLFSTSIVDPPRMISDRQLKPGEIEFPLPPRLVRGTGVRKGVLSWAGFAGDPQLASGLAELQERYTEQMERALETRASYWERIVQSGLPETDVEAPSGETALKAENQKLGPQHPGAVNGGTGNRADQRATNWEDIKVAFISDERVQVTIGEQTETRNYTEMGFEDGRNGKPNRAWLALLVLAQSKGVIRDPAKTGGDWPGVEKRIQEIRKVLRKHFGIPGDALPFVKGTGYRARFRIDCAPSYDS